MGHRASAAGAHSPAGPVPTIRAVLSVATLAATASLAVSCGYVVLGHFIHGSTKATTTHLNKERRTGMAAFPIRFSSG